jgi:hypothetical protein
MDFEPINKVVKKLPFIPAGAKIAEMGMQAIVGPVERPQTNYVRTEEHVRRNVYATYKYNSTLNFPKKSMTLITGEREYIAKEYRIEEFRDVYNDAVYQSRLILRKTAPEFAKIAQFRMTINLDCIFLHPVSGLPMINTFIAPRSDDTNLSAFHLPENLKGEDAELERLKIIKQESRLGYVVSEKSLEREIRAIISKLLSQIETFNNMQSGNAYNRIKSFSLNFHRSNRPKGAGYIELPRWVQLKKAVINIKSYDDFCFKYAITAYFHPAAKNSDRLSNYEEAASANKEGIDYSMLRFPVEIDKYRFLKFELANEKAGISLCVYTIDGEQEYGGVYPIYNTAFPNRIHKIDILYFESHYCLIKDISRLMRSSITKHKGVLHLCRNCGQNFTDEKILSEHITNCNIHGPQLIEMPKADLYFTDTKKCQRQQYAIYADFESFIVDCQPTPGSDQSIVDLNTHMPNSFCMRLVCDKPGRNKTLLYNIKPNEGHKELIDVFYKYLYVLYDSIKDLVEGNTPMALSYNDSIAHSNARNCYICNKYFNEKNYKVRDHDHVTGHYRGAACNLCNLAMKQHKMVPVIMHNLRGYDGHLILKEINSTKLEAIPQAGDKFLNFKVDGKFNFIDSFRFMSASLDKLADNLGKDIADKRTVFVNTKGICGVSPTGGASTGEIDLIKLGLITRKGVYPYEWVKSVECFSATELPPREAFYSQLSDGGISEEEYEHAKLVWKTFDCKTFVDYHNIYLQTDVMLLADIFESFRSFSLQTYKLDPVHFVSLPSLSWTAMLLYQLDAYGEDPTIPYKLELLKDYNMYLMFEKGIRGGICQISHRFANVNGCEEAQSCETTHKEKTYIRYWDANNLYGWAMSQYVPIGDFKWVDEECINSILNTPDDADTGYVLECDFSYPKELHDLHSDYPLAPENMNITPDMYSEYLATQIANNDLLTSKKNNKLVLSMLKKKKYVIHYRALKLYISLGLKLKKVHRVISFRQYPFLKGFIGMNTQMRAKAKTDFEKDLFKLANNSLFGKTMQNDRKHSDCKFVTFADDIETTDEEQQRAIRTYSSVFCKSFRIINKRTVLYEYMKKKLRLNKPIYIGTAILDISKTLMYDFHYNSVKKWYPDDKSKLLFTDTDSLCYLIKTPDITADLLKPERNMLFDHSEFPVNHPLYSAVNKKVLGKFKDESPGREIVEFVGLRAKVYSLMFEDDKEKKRLKGVKTKVVDNQIRHEHYKHILHSATSHMKHKFNMIRSKNNMLYTTSVNKISLSNTDDKRYLLNAIESVPYGHYKIAELNRPQTVALSNLVRHEVISYPAEPTECTDEALMEWLKDNLD